MNTNAKCLFTVFLIAGVSIASDQAEFRMIGYSTDGLYAAWRMDGVQDGSGFQWVKVEILDTSASASAAEYSFVWNDFIDEFPGEADVKPVENEIAELCNSYGIVPGNAGTPLVYHYLTDLGVSGDTVSFCLESYTPDYNSGKITLTLETGELERNPDYPDWFPLPVTPILILTDGGETETFFKEEIPAEKYNMNFGYSIFAVYKNPAVNNSLQVVLSSALPGFEGSDGRFRVVSGRI